MQAVIYPINSIHIITNKYQHILYQYDSERINMFGLALYPWLQKYQQMSIDQGDRHKFNMFGLDSTLPLVS